MHTSRIILLLALPLFAGCYSATKTQRLSLQAIPATYIGKFTDDYGSIYQISNAVWTQNKNITYHLKLYNKQAQYFIAQNDSANPSDPGLYTRIDVMNFEQMEPWAWGYCLTAYKAGSLEEAVRTASADRKNPRKGCNGYPFSRMKKE